MIIARRSRTAVERSTPHLYTEAAHDCARRVLQSYSTSFSLAVRLLAPDMRRDIGSIYALVRVADEIVDGAVAVADHDLQFRCLTTLRSAIDAAMSCGFSENLIVHAFADVARRCDIDHTLIDPFFASMRADIDPQPHDSRSLADYVDGSAEVVGLMCLRVFLTHQPLPDSVSTTDLVESARALGRAFQMVNFVRDLQADTALHRSYLSSAPEQGFTDVVKAHVLDDIQRDLATAQRGIDVLPSGCRGAVQTAHDLFAELCRLLSRTPAATIAQQRTRIANPRKAFLAARALWRTHRALQLRPTRTATERA